MTDFFKPLQKDPYATNLTEQNMIRKNKGLNSFLTNLHLTYFSVSQKGSHNMAKGNNKNYIGFHDIITLKSVLYRVGMTLKVLSRDPIQNTYSMKELPY